MGKSVTTSFIAVALLVLLSAANAQEPEPVGPKLPSKVRDLLVQEMVAVQGAAHEILDALIRGQDDVVAEKAQAIHDSFILQQQMTEEDRQALIAAVPEAFVQRDRAFHALTADLAEAARQGRSTEQAILFGDVMQACVACHERYATNRFPGLR